MKLLGELPIEIDGKQYVLKPTFKALLAIEELSGKTLSELLKLFLSSKAGVKDVTAVIYGGMLGKNGDRPLLTYDQVGELIMSNFYSFLPHCITIIGSAYSGKPIDEALRLREEAKSKAEQSETEEKKTEPS